MSHELDVCLAIDTATDRCSAALLVGEQIVSEQREGARTHARLLPTMISEICAQQNVPMDQITGVVYGAGPGSFTGLRIGIALAQGIAVAGNLPMAGLSSLQAIAQAAMIEHPEWQSVCVVNDAHMGEVFVGRYIREDSGAVSDVPDALLAPDAVDEVKYDAFIGDGVALCPALTEVNVPSTPIGVSSAEALLELARCGVPMPWTSADEARASYLRRDDAIASKPRHRD